MTTRIYHNPRCSKSRATLELLRENGMQPQVVEYLETPPSTGELREIISALGIEPKALLRTGEAAFTSAGLDADNVSDEAIIAAMVATPILIERPIVVANGKAVIGRPPENVLKII